MKLIIKSLLGLLLLVVSKGFVLQKPHRLHISTTTIKQYTFAPQKTILDSVAESFSNREFARIMTRGLVADVLSDNEDARKKALFKLKFLSVNSDISMYMLSTEVRLLPALVSAMKTAYGDCFLALEALYSALETYNKYSCDKEKDSDYSIYDLCSADLGLLNALAMVVSYGHGIICSRALEIIRILVDKAENRSVMGSSEFKILYALQDIFGGSDDQDNLQTAIEIADLLSEEPGNRMYMCSHDLNLLLALVRVTSCGTKDINYTALKILEVLSLEPSSDKKYLGSAELGLVSALVSKIGDLSFDQRITEKAIDILEVLAAEPSNRKYMRSSTLGLVIALIKVKSTDKTKKILDLILFGGDMDLPIDSEPSTPPPQTLDTLTNAEIWALISEDPSKAVDPEKLTALLFDLGLSRADELGYCDSAMWADLAAHLKPIPKRELLHILAKNNISVGK